MCMQRSCGFEGLDYNPTLATNEPVEVLLHSIKKQAVNYPVLSVIPSHGVYICAHIRMKHKHKYS